MAEGTGTRVIAWVALVVALAANAVILFVSPIHDASYEPRGASSSASLDAEIARLRASYEDLCRAQQDLQRRNDELGRELDALRNVMENAHPSAPTEEPIAPKAATTGLRCVVQAVDNKQDLYVISLGSKDGVTRGMEFDISRGTERIGTIVIDRVFPNYSSGNRKQGAKAFNVSAGDECTAVASKQDCPTMPAIRGVVRATDPPSDVWVVSAGRADKVEPGFEFTVFRGSDYVTTLVIDEVREHESRGHSKPGTQKRPIRDGDECATRL